jgi:hypothetical protein
VPPSYRLAANLEYRVSFTFGRDDDPEDGTDAGISARLTLNPGVRAGAAAADRERYGSR